MEYYLHYPPPPQITDTCNNMDKPTDSHYTEQKKSDIKICIEVSMCELKHLKITLEEFVLRIKNRVISQYRYELDKLYNGVVE